MNPSKPTWIPSLPYSFGWPYQYIFGAASKSTFLGNPWIDCILKAVNLFQYSQDLPESDSQKIKHKCCLSVVWDFPSAVSTGLYIGRPPGRFIDGVWGGEPRPSGKASKTWIWLFKLCQVYGRQCWKVHVHVRSQRLCCRQGSCEHSGPTGSQYLYLKASPLPPPPSWQQATAGWLTTEMGDFLPKL